jgi:uncharacterized protein YcbX
MNMSETIDANPADEIIITNLHVYPIKSAGGIALPEVKVTETGLQHDRMFMLIDENGKFISQRTKDIGPKLVNIIPYYIHPLSNELGVEIQNFDSHYASRPYHLRLPLFSPSAHGAVPRRDLVSAELHGKEVTGVSVGTHIDETFSKYLGTSVRLLRMLSGSRPISEAKQRRGAANQTGFADAYPMLLTSRKSLAELSRHEELRFRYKGGLPMERFRPNIVVDGDDLPAYDEDHWRFIRFAGNVGAHVVKPCVRCVIPDTDQHTGVVGKEVRKALQQTRKGVSLEDGDPGTFFGQNLNHTGPGNILKTGARLMIVERADEPNVILKSAA